MKFLLDHYCISAELHYVGYPDEEGDEVSSSSEDEDEGGDILEDGCEEGNNGENNEGSDNIDEIGETREERGTGRKRENYVLLN